jgi:hypothetical protein
VVETTNASLERASSVKLAVMTEGAAGALGGVGDAFKGVGGAINIESLNTGVQTMVRGSCP